MIAAALFCNLLWGSAFPFIKLGYAAFGIVSEDTASQILFAGTRFTLAGILTIAIGSLASHQFLAPTKKNIPSIMKLSLFQTILQYFFFYVALAHTTGVKASIIEASNVFFAILFTAVFMKSEKNLTRKLLWCIPGFLGVLLINLNGQTLQFSFAWNGEGFILLSTLAASCSTVLIKKYSQDVSPVLLSGWQFVFGGALMAIAGFVLGGRLHALSGTGWWILLWLAFVSAAAYSIWSLLLKYHPVSKVAVFGFSNPVFGVFLSALLLHESLSSMGATIYIALALVCLGIYEVNHN